VNDNRTTFVTFAKKINAEKKFSRRTHDLILLGV